MTQKVRYFSFEPLAVNPKVHHGAGACWNPLTSDRIEANVSEQTAAGMPQRWEPDNFGLLSRATWQRQIELGELLQSMPR